METPYLPHDVVVSKILVHLPVGSLLRFRCVCREWRDAIDEDSFHRTHHRLQDSSSVLIALKVMNEDKHVGLSTRTAGFYRWDRKGQQGQDAATLVCAVGDGDSFFSVEHQVRHNPGHCDGLVLLPADAIVPVRVLNPATRRVLELPSSPHAVAPSGRHLRRSAGHQAFGLGHDPRSGTHKVARFFYRSLDKEGAAGGYSYTLGMEVFTIGRDQCWRETDTPPPYPIMPARTATFYKGSLLWTVEERLLLENAPGFVRLKLEDESFGVMVPPPCRPRLVDYVSSSLAELHGELCLCLWVAQQGSEYGTLEMWMCSDDLDGAQMHWDRRYVVARVPHRPGIRVLRLIAVFDEEIVFEADPGYLFPVSIPQCVLKDMVMMQSMRYNNPQSNTLDEYPTEIVYTCETVPYVPSLFPL